MTVSLRTPQVRDPVETFTSTGEWVTRDEEGQFYHTHPDVFDLATVKNVVESRFPGGLNIQDLCPTPSDPLENFDECKEFQNLDQNRMISLRKNIEHSHSELAIEASVDGNTDKRTSAEYQRTLKHGNERYENLLLSDHKESHRSEANVIPSYLKRRDVDWIL